MGTLPLSEVIAGFALNSPMEAVPQEVREHAKLLVLDSLGVAIAAFHLEHARCIRAVATHFGSRPESTLWGTQHKVGSADAVLANAALIHGMDFDDTHVGGVVHPSASVLSTAFAVGEATGASGREILSAIICGYEIIIRLALAARGGFHDRGFHATGIVAPFASACVAAKLLGLSKDVLVNAMGICGSQAAALQEFLHDGSGVKKIHPGWGGHAGIYALKMAEGGFTGPRKVLEGEFGLYASHLGSANGVQEVFADLRQTWHTREISVKLYPCCHMIHSFIDCILDLQEQHGFTAPDIAAIECRIDTRCSKIVCEPVDAKRRPTSEYGMRFSLPYIVAMAVLNHRISPNELEEKWIEERAVKVLIDKVTCIADDATRKPGHFPGWVKVTLADGTVCHRIQQYERGAKENPIDERAVVTKYRNNASGRLNAQKAEGLLNMIRQLDTLPNVRGLLDQLMMD